jgi:hypothetical protein
MSMWLRREHVARSEEHIGSEEEHDATGAGEELSISSGLNIAK